MLDVTQFLDLHNQGQTFSHRPLKRPGLPLKFYINFIGDPYSWRFHKLIYCTSLNKLANDSTWGRREQAWHFNTQSNTLMTKYLNT